MKRTFLQKVFLISSDLFAILVAFLIAIFLTRVYHEELIGNAIISFFNPGVSKFLGVFVIAVFAYYGHYSKRRPFWEEQLQLLKIVALILIMNLGIAFVLGKGSLKILIVSFWLVLVGVIPFFRLLTKKIMNAIGIWSRDLYIVGTSANALHAYKLFAKNKLMGYNLVAFVDVSADLVKLSQLPVAMMNKDDFISKVIQNNECDIIVALNYAELNSHVQMINFLQHNSLSLLILPDISGLALYGARVEHFFGNEQLVLRLNTNLSNVMNRILKRGFDIVVVCVIMVLLSPFMLAIALAIKLTTRSNVFFAHSRVGRYGQAFKCLKFQSMYPNSKELLAELLASDPAAKAEWESCFKLKNDPRVTPIGKFLRATSLDELPQLFNVLIGQMSLVGPRPIVTAEIERYQDGYYYYQMVLPGITGLWQVSGRSDVDYVNRVRLDEWYVKNWSMWYDIVILLKTCGVVLKRTGAY